MSNIGTLNRVSHPHLIHRVAVAIALFAAFVAVSMPKPDAAAGTADRDANVACLQSCCLQTCCLQTWPYYEHSCLRDSGQRSGNARAVRVIAINGQAVPVSRQ